MRYEGKTENDAVEAAAQALGVPAGELKYKVVRDEKSFWGGRVVEIELEAPGRATEMGIAPSRLSDEADISDDDTLPGPGSPVERPPAATEGEPRKGAPRGATDPEAFTAVEASLTELLSAAGFFVEIRRRQAQGDEMLFELMGDDVEPLLAGGGEGLSGLEVLVGRIASKQLGRPVYPRLDAEGFRAHQRESLEELAQRSAEEVKRTRRPQLLPPLSPAERRLIHLALAEDPEVETISEGEGFLKRVAVRPKAS
ncbi:MAG TPA: R3H domain-containing nucleic acid-binding protein [Thermoanaerobaculia bacterium]|nr:R3H domain-containing nucleic acid-binding protein [Thermoanaerobaculia bacterium]